MKHTFALATFLACTGTASAVNLFSPTDFIIAIDRDGEQSTSNFPDAEAPANIVDGDPDTKYLNFGGQNSGFIVTPDASSTIQSVQFTTANDAPERDPASFQLFGTNDPISSTNNSFGLSEPWTMITTSALSLPTERLTAGTPVDFANTSAFSSYRVVFDSLRDNNAVMQVADVQFYTGTGGTGSLVLSAGNPVIATDLDSAPDSSFPNGEAPGFAIDGDSGTKYLNFGSANAGFIITPSVGPSVANEFTITTGGDAPERDPASYQIFGTNDPITSAENSDGDSEFWNLIAAGDLALPGDRNALGDTVAFANSDAYSSYRVVFDSLRDGGAANSLQFSEIQFGGTVVPEPSAGALALLAGMAMLFRRRR